MLAKVFSWDPPLYVVLPILAVVIAVAALLYGGPVLTGFNVLLFCGAATGTTLRTLRTKSRFREKVTRRSWRLIEAFFLWTVTVMGAGFAEGGIGETALVVWLVGVSALGVAWFTWGRSGRESPRLS